MNELSRRGLLKNAGLLLGGVGLLQACGSDSDPASADATPEPQPQDGQQPVQQVTAKLSQFPYEQHLAAGYQLDPAVVREVAYHGYYEGGCCHGAYKGLLDHLAKTAGEPFNLLPLDFGKFGGGGIAGFGSICGAVLGSVLVMNMIVPEDSKKLRSALLTHLMRWYEGSPFPSYTPRAIDTKEAGTTLPFATDIASVKRAPKSHLCHASVSDWCAAFNVAATSPDKLARCARLTADVAGKAAEMLNEYLSTKSFAAVALDDVSRKCTSCHTPAAAFQTVAAGMNCGTCHTDKLTGHPNESFTF